MSRTDRFLSFFFRVAFALACVLSIRAFALDPSLHVSRFARQAWSEDEGLPQNSVIAMAQTPDGYIWLGTDNGLARFDGLSFTVFNWDNHNLEANLILGLAVEGDGTIWVTDMNIHRYVDGKFQRWTAKDGIDPNGRYSVLRTAPDGSVWMAGRSSVLQVRGGKVIARYGAAEGVPAGAVASIQFDREGRLWLSTVGRGVKRLENGAFRQVLMRNLPAASIVDTMTFDRQGNLWAATVQGLIRRTPDGTTRLFTPAEGAPRDLINALITDRDGNIWIGVDGEGLLRYTNGVFTRFSRGDGLSDDSVMALFEDRDGALWAGTRVGGVNRFRSATFLNYTMADGLGSTAAGPLEQDRLGRIWVGTIGGGLSVLGPDDRFTTFTMKDGLPNNAVWALESGSDGTLWAGTASGLVALRDGRFRTYTAKDGLAADAIASIEEEDRTGRIWVGTLDAGLSIFDRGRFTKTLNKQSGLIGNNVRLIHESADGAMWVVVGPVIHEIRGDRVVKKHRMKVGATAICEDPDGTLWFASFSGEPRIHRYRDGKLMSLPAASTLADRHTYGMVDDGRGFFWITGLLGISRVSKAQLNEVIDGKRARLDVRIFDKDDGMLSREGALVRHSALRSADGSLWFATSRGVSVVQPSRILPDVPLGAVLIQQIATDAGAVKGSRIEGGVRRLSIRYTAPSFALPSRTTFSYRLEGFEDDWTSAGNRRLVEYTNLPPGAYVFRVRAENEAGRAAAMVASQRLFIAPRWHETWWSRVILALSVLLVLAGLYWLRLRRVSARETQLQQVVGERTMQLHDANRRLEESNQELMQMTFSDLLTGAASRAHFDQYLERELRSARRGGLTVSLIVLDVDRLREINERQGRRRGDVVLREIAEVLRQAATGSADLVARFGGDELAIVLPGATESEAMTLARRILAAVQTLKTATITGGVASASADEDLSADLLIAKAEHALFRAKDGGRNQVEGSELEQLPSFGV